MAPAFTFDSLPLCIETDLAGDIWFKANDVCAALGYENPSKAISTHVDPEDVAKRDTPTEGGIQRVNYINEPGLSALIAAMLLVGVVRETDRMAAEKSWVARAAAQMEQTADARGAAP